MSNQSEDSITHVLLGAVLGIVIMVFLVNVVPTMLGPTNDDPTTFSKYGDMLGAFLGAGIAIYYAARKDSRAEDRKRKALATAVRPEVVLNLQQINYALAMKLWPTFKNILVQRLYDHLEYFGSDTVVTLNLYRWHLDEVLKILELRDGKGVIDLEEMQRATFIAFEAQCERLIIALKTEGATITPYPMPQEMPDGTMRFVDLSQFGGWPIMVKHDGWDAGKPSKS